MKNIKFRKVNNEDIELITKWLGKSYIRKWYHEPEEWLIEIKERNSTYNWLNHFIVIIDSIPIGFAQYYDCFDSKEYEDWYSINDARYMYSIDYLIGEEEYLYKGYGKLIVNNLTRLIFDKEKAKIIVVQPDSDNYASNNVLIANGYSFDNNKQYYFIKK